MKVAINPNILKWARERSLLSVEQLADKIDHEPDDIYRWEAGLRKPSYTVLEKLAYQHLHIPLAVFFFSEPPEIEDPVGKFRWLPDSELLRLSSDTLWKMRVGQSYQESLAELAQSPPPRGKIFREISPRGLTVERLAQQARGFLGVSLQTQYSFKDSDAAFKHWRHALEEAGIYAFKDTFKDKHISGFCLLDDNYPIIFINNSTAHTRQIFTLIHELGHILYGVYGLTDIDETYLNQMSAHDRELEMKCNKFAAEFLVPSDAFKDDIHNFRHDNAESLAWIAKKYSVSREVILRRLLDVNVISQNYYKTKAAEWNREYLRQSGERAGGNYYLTRLAYLGEGYARLAYANYASGRIAIEELASHLRVKAIHIDKWQSEYILCVLNHLFVEVLLFLCITDMSINITYLTAQPLM